MAQPIHPGQAAALRGRWLWLFPASYAIHIAEEGLAGERFYRWIGRVTGREISPGVFAGVNLAYEAAMVAAVRRALAREDAAWVPALGTITAMNGIGHLAGSAATRSYSPGVVSGVGVWAPLGLFAVIRSRQLLPRPVWRRGITAGALMLGSVRIWLAACQNRKGDQQGTRSYPRRRSAVSIATSTREVMPGTSTGRRPAT